jgi:hypothetical protein
VCIRAFALRARARNSCKSYKFCGSESSKEFKKYLMRYENLSLMTRAERIFNLLGVVVPFIGVLVAVVLLWNRAVDAVDLGIFAVM